MNSFKNTLRKIGKYIAYAMLFLSSLLIVGVIAGATYYYLVEDSDRNCDNQFIYGCMSAGLSEEVCKDRVY